MAHGNPHPLRRAPRRYSIGERSPGPVFTNLFKNIPYDDMEFYSDGAALNGQSGGYNGNHLFVIAWNGAYVAEGNFTGILANDTLETYSDGFALSGLNGGSGYTGAYVAGVNFLGLLAGDTFESYSDGSAVDGLNNGTNYASTWNGTGYSAR